MSLAKYEQVEATVAHGSALEARALTVCAKRLAQAQDANDRELLMNAVMQNSKLWLLFYSEIESGRVQLPPEIAQNIMSLAAYVASVAPRAYVGEDEVLKTLININRNIAAGLSEGGGGVSENQAPVAQLSVSGGVSVST
jgi:flagellar protein FlaF